MDKSKIEVKNLNFYYGHFNALSNVNMEIKNKTITAIIGPSGCGKSTLLRTFNRMNDLIIKIKVEGSIIIDDEDIYSPRVNLVQLRKKVGMVFQRPNPFPLSIKENLLYGLKVHKMETKENIIETCLKGVGLWNELKDGLSLQALDLSLEQQQRLCIARVLAVQPEILLMDEPCSALDPIATSRIEDLMRELKKRYAVIIVTHNMQQAARVSDETGFMLLGELVEFGDTKKIFTNPTDKRTEEYITGRYG